MLTKHENLSQSILIRYRLLPSHVITGSDCFDFQYFPCEINLLFYRKIQFSPWERMLGSLCFVFPLHYMLSNTYFTEEKFQREQYAENENRCITLLHLHAIFLFLICTFYLNRIKPNYRRTAAPGDFKIKEATIQEIPYCSNWNYRVTTIGLHFPLPLWVN